MARIFVSLRNIRLPGSAATAPVLAADGKAIALQPMEQVDVELDEEVFLALCAQQKDSIDPEFEGAPPPRIIDHWMLEEETDKRLDTFATLEQLRADQAQQKADDEAAARQHAIDAETEAANADFRDRKAKAEAAAQAEARARGEE